MKETNQTFRLHSGALADSIKKQVKQQGFIISDDLAAKFQKIHDSIIMLKFHGYMPESAAHKAMQKLCNKIGKELQTIKP